MDATAQNAGIEYANGPQARTIFSFKVDAASDTPRLTTFVLSGGQVNTDFRR
jgi:hypothetical protein